MKTEIETKTTKEVSKCPVMEGTPVDKEEAERNGLVRDHQGKKYYFCCDPCLKSWDANPEYYAK